MTILAYRKWKRAVPLGAMALTGCMHAFTPQVQMRSDDLFAQRELAGRLLSSKSNVDLSSGAILLERVASNGDAISQFSIGTLYIDGKVVKQNPEVGAGWIRKSADANNAVAQYLMAQLFRKGLGVPQSNAEARSWATLAVENGNALANVTLGQLESDSPSNSGSAMRYFQAAADHKIAAGMWYLGDAYREGKGVTPDPVVAYAWFSLTQTNASGPNDRLAGIRGQGQLEATLLPEERAIGARLASEWVPGDDLAAKHKKYESAPVDTIHWSSASGTSLVAAPALAKVAGLPSSRKHLALDYKVNEDGSYVAAIHVEIEVHNQSAAQSLSQPTFEYNEKLDVLEIAEAVTLKADGRRLPVEPSAIHDQLPKETADSLQFSDDWQKAVLFPDVQAGDTLIYTLRYISKPRLGNAFMLVRSFSPLLQDHDVSIRIWAPKSMPLMTESHDMKFEKRPDGNGIVYQWHWSNPAPLAEYPIAVDELDRAPRMFASSFKTYEQLGRAYGAMNAKQAAITPLIKERAEQISPGESDPRQQVEAIYNWVRQNIRYVQVRLGSAGIMESHDADSILANGYGDCKDHSTLFSALLAAKGIASETVLINLGNNYTLSGPPTFGALNHAITWIPQLNLYADTTAGVAPLGTLPFEEYGKPVVHTLKDASAVAHAPLLPVDSATVENHITMHLEKDGSITGDSRVVATGPYAVRLRQIALNIQAYGLEPAAKLTLQSWGINGTGSFDIESPYRASREYEISGHFKTLARPDYLKGASFRPLYGLTVIGQPGAELIGPYDLVDMSASEPTPCFSGRQIFEESVELPEGITVQELPKETEFKETNVTYRSRWALDRRMLTLRREFVSTIQEPVCIGEVRQQTARILNNIRTDAYSSVTLISK